MTCARACVSLCMQTDISPEILAWQTPRAIRLNVEKKLFVFFFLCNHLFYQYNILMTIYYANTNIVYQSHPPFSRHVLKHESIRTAALSLHLVHEKLFTTPERGIRPPARSYHLSPPQLRAAEEARDRPEVLWDIYWFWSKAATDVLNLPERDNSSSSPRPGSHASLSKPSLGPNDQRTSSASAYPSLSPVHLSFPPFPSSYPLSVTQNPPPTTRKIG